MILLFVDCGGGGRKRIQEVKENSRFSDRNIWENDVSTY